MVKILIVVDVQNDFISGSLPVPNAAEIIPVINSIKDSFYKVFWTRDWHPSSHCSFEINGGIWPIHCVQDSVGSRINEELDVDIESDIIIDKGIDVNIDSYSGFYDNDRSNATQLVEDLKKIKDLMNDDLIIYICGLATDYCVKFTALDSVKEGYKTNLIIDACRGITTESSDMAVSEMFKAGVMIMHSELICGKK